MSTSSNSITRLDGGEGIGDVRGEESSRRKGGKVGRSLSEAGGGGFSSGVSSSIPS